MTEELAESLIKHQEIVHQITVEVVKKFHRSIDEEYSKYEGELSFVDTITITSNVMNSIVLGHLEMVCHAKDGNDELIQSVTMAWSEKIFLLLNDIEKFRKPRTEVANG